MVESNKNTTWEEQIYWKNFHFAHFSLTLPNDFHHHLTLPKKFTDYMRTKLPEQIVLKVGGVSWNVNLKTDNKDDIMFEGGEWEEFVNAYSLKKADILLFKYNRQECFEVWLFDRASSCEIEASYFVRKDQQKKSVDEGQDHESSEETKKNLSKELDDTSQGDYSSDDITPETNSGRTARTRDSFDEQDKSDEISDEEFSVYYEVKTTPKKADAATATATAGVRKSRSYISSKRKHDDVEKISQKENISSGYKLCYISNRRAVTDLEIKNALTKARVASKHCVNSFIVVMRPSSVYKRFFLTIPSHWDPTTHLRKGQKVTLRVGEKEWDCRVCFTKKNSGLQGSEWISFARDNCLEEFDVCLFVPSASANGRYVIFDVSIFRVVQEIVPPTPITSLY